MHAASGENKQMVEIAADSDIAPDPGCLGPAGVGWAFGASHDVVGIAFGAALMRDLYDLH